ncbi:MAG: FAD-dependent oxidoreductase, partial [Janthinobacterium lividum]
IVFDGLDRGGGQSASRAHHTDPRVMMRRLEEAVLAAGVCCRTGAPALGLERRDAATFRVLTADGAVETRGVVLATGGFALSEPLLGAFAGDLDGALRVGAAGSRGYGLRMGCALGAGLRDMGNIKGTFGAHPDSGGAEYHTRLAFYMGGIIVNRDGKHFVNEEVSYELISDACLRQPHALGFQVFDEGAMRRSRPGLPLFDLAAQLDAGRLLRADTPEALATACGMDDAGLARTLAQYDAGVDAGCDALGRAGLCNGVGSLVRLDRPPFYAFPSRTALLATYCGLAVDLDAAVLDSFDRPIDGLYAAGEVAGGFHGRAYMTGAALGSAAFLGRRVGMSAARHAARTAQERGDIR